MEYEPPLTEDPLQTLALGIVSATNIEVSFGSQTQPRFTCAGIGQGSHALEIHTILNRARSVTETATGRIFFRLGDEFLSPEVLVLVAQRHPLPDVRTQAAKILAKISTH